MRLCEGRLACGVGVGFDLLWLGDVTLAYDVVLGDALTVERT